MTNHRHLSQSRAGQFRQRKGKRPQESYSLRLDTPHQPKVKKQVKFSETGLNCRMRSGMKTIAEKPEEFSTL